MPGSWDESAVFLLTDHGEALAEFLPRLVGGSVPDPSAKGLSHAFLDPAWTAMGIAGKGSPRRSAEGRRLFGRDVPLCLLATAAPRSQFDALRETASRRGGANEPVLCLTLEGEACHGQHGRPWRALAGNLHLSLILPCDLPAATVGPVLPALPAVAMCEALGDMLPDSRKPGVKWVNDILVGGRKLAGGLTAVRTVEGRIRDLILGMGVNVAVAPDLEAAPGHEGAICLRECRPERPWDLESVLAAVWEAVCRRADELARQGPAPLLEAYRKVSLVVGREVDVWAMAQATPTRTEGWGPPDLTTVVEGVNEDLSLRLRGRQVPFREGRLRLRRHRGA